MRKPALFFIICAILFPLTLRAEEVFLTMDEAIAIALRDNRDVLLKAEEVEKAKEKISEAKGGLLPTLDFTGSRTLTRGLYAKDIAQTTTQATLKQYLYKGGKTLNSIEENRYEFKVSQALLDKIRLETLLNVKKAFYTFLLTKEFAGLNKDIIDNTKLHGEVVKARFQHGQLSESDVLKIQESLSRVIEAYETSLNQVDSSEAVLRNFLYLDETVSIRPLAEFTYEPRDVAYTEGFLEAMKTRPEIRQYIAQENADNKAIEVAKADGRPNIYASWDYYSRSTTSLTFSPNKGWQDYNIIGLTFTWPIFDGRETRAKVEEAIIDLKETRLLKEKSVKDIALELKNAYLDLKNAVAKIKSSQAQINLYKDTLSVIKEKYDAGVASSLDLNDASLGYEVSLFNQKQAIYDYILAEARFDKATGGI
ncbi:MAG: TolC family protein [Candidatus Omnitrophota bacterium]